MTRTDRIYTLERKINKLKGKRYETKTNHIFHLIFSIVTFGLWVPFWLLFGLNNLIERKKIDSMSENLERQLSLLLEGV